MNKMGYLLASIDHTFANVATSSNTIYTRFGLAWLLFLVGFVLYLSRNTAEDEKEHRQMFNAGISLMALSLVLNSMLLYWLSRVRTKQHTAMMKIQQEHLAPMVLPGAGYDPEKITGSNTIFDDDSIGEESPRVKELRGLGFSSVSLSSLSSK